MSRCETGGQSARERMGKEHRPFIASQLEQGLEPFREGHGVHVLDLRTDGGKQAFLDLVEKEESRGFARAYQPPAEAA